MSARRTVALLVAALAYYVFVIGDRAVALLRDPRLAFRGLGAGLLLLGGVGVALIVAELRFGREAGRLATRYGDTPAPDFDDAKVTVETSPEDWRAWYGLALAYDTGRDRPRAREAMRTAIRLSRRASSATR